MRRSAQFLRTGFVFVSLACTIVFFANLINAQSMEHLIHLPLLATPREFEVTPTTTEFGLVTDIAHAGDDRLFIVELEGLIQILHPDQAKSTFLDIRSLVKSDGDEEGMFGLAFDPNYQENGYFYVTYSSDDEGLGLYVTRFSVSADKNVADENSAEVQFYISMETDSHNGGAIRYNPIDGYFYLGVGDDLALGNAQSDTFKGKLIRLIIEDGALVDHKIVAKGLRNPWRIGIDSRTGDIFIGDVGDRDYEEVNLLPIGEEGANFGWPCYEGPQLEIDLDECNNPNDFTFPIYYYTDGCGVTGGEVAYAGQNRQYIFADLCRGVITSLQQQNNNWQHRPAGDMPLGSGLITTFGLSMDGRVYAGTLSPGPIYEIYVPFD